MSVKIRLRRMGKKKQPHYRIVVTDSRAPRDGRFVENLGYYNPIKHPAMLSVDLGRVEYWVGQGAIVSPTVRSLVSKARAGGDDTVALVGALADADASAEAAAANGASAQAASDAGDSAGVEAAVGDAGADAPAAADDTEEAEAAAAAETADAAETDAAEAPAAE
ncbi:MAG: 30S ribosomal protein S16, partial [Gemmatimonadetes bacterium]|nr:30S ribosomal protein S16 [Gemmatimonadota bacterium]